MSALESGNTRKNLTQIVFALLFIVMIILGGGYFLAPRFERDAPQIRFTPDSGLLGLAPMEIAVSDPGAGLKSVMATLSAGGSERTLATEQFDQAVAEKKIVVAVSSKLTGLKEGPAILRVIARDRSLWNLFQGNETVVEKTLTIDITAPVVELIADDRYINFGGVGVIVYKSSADTATSGVRMGSYFFPGVQGQIKDHPDHFIALFAHPYNLGAEVKAVLVATDKAGNSQEMPLAYELKNVKYKKSTIALSDNFLQKITPLLSDVGARQGTPQEVFVRINKGLRKENEDKIIAVTSKSTPSMAEASAPAAARAVALMSKLIAGFAYVVPGAMTPGHCISMGTRMPPSKVSHFEPRRGVLSEPANSGSVAFAGDLGIYGNTVILDHGLGLFTLYAHLSSIDVKVGETITQRQTLGKTGETGMAAGDHLHYGVYLNGVAILPVEWWDQKWITDNIQPKLEGRTGEAIARAQQVKGPQKSTQKRRR